MKLCTLPSEIEEEILSRVPIKSLRLLRATGKRWYHHPLFKDPRFIKRYSDRTPRKYHKEIVLNEFRIQSLSSYVDHRRISPSRFLLMDPVSNEKVDIAHAFHCDGILLCTNTKDKRFVAWKPFSGQTRWIQPREIGVSSYRSYALGYDNKELCRSYKILRSLEDQTVEIYEFKSDSWRNLDDVSPGGSFESLGVSLKGNAYWISRRGGAKEYSLLEFDFSTERFQNHYLPFHEADCLGPYVLKECLNNLALSVVKEDRLCLFYESKTKSKTEIWMSSEIGETASVSWFKFLAEDATPFFTRHVSFYVDDEVKIAYCFYNHERNVQNFGRCSKLRILGDVPPKNTSPCKHKVFKYLGWHHGTASGPIVFSYLPWSV
uniref:Putative F-box protein n=1 Tax=Noccaea caerulescens TaxID=107243 RepID=A0A1J3DR84_NOCCA